MDFVERRGKHMIQTLDVQGMNHRFNYSLKFNPDMNVLTGLNGSGKTTLLKLIWYLTSGNLHRIISEIPFTSVKIETIWFNLSIEQKPEGRVKLEWEFTDKSPSGKSQSGDMTLDSKSPANNLGNLNEQIANVVPGSLFFPTFRRLEGNYPAEPTMSLIQNVLLKVQNALSAKGKSEKRHKFITVTSTGDVDPLLKSKRERLKQLQQKEEPTFTEEEDAETLEERFSLLEQIVEDIYDDYNKIIISADISFEGKGSWTISSETLSSGEKQLLGFLCHNAFSVDALMFLDEPELSLHVDYQRLILQLLEAQGTEKQIFVATHSPFIYARYSQKEINLEEKTDGSES